MLSPIGGRLRLVSLLRVLCHLSRIFDLELLQMFGAKNVLWERNKSDGRSAGRGSRDTNPCTCLCARTRAMVIKYKTDFDKAVLLDNFERRHWVRTEDDWNFFWARCGWSLLEA